jgi:hypothetical protein
MHILAHLFQEGSGRPLRLLGQDRGEEFTRIVIDGDKWMFCALLRGFAFQQWQAPDIRMVDLSVIVLVTSFRLLLQLCLQGGLDFCEVLDDRGEKAKTLVGVRVDLKVLATTALEDFVNRGSANPIIACEISHPTDICPIGVIYSFALFKCQTYFLMKGHKFRC